MGEYNWLLLLLSAISLNISQYSKGKLFVGELIEECPGRYCGRTIDQATGKISECGACPRGSRSNGTFCNKCTHTLQMYDWSYLGFTFLTVLVLHWFFVDYFSKRSRQVIIILFACGAVETFCAAFFTLLLNEPKGTLSLTSCSSEELSDWYTVFYNPKPDYVNTIYCTNEAVYPLYTIVLTFYAICVAMLIVIRPLISHYLCAGQGLSSIYASMYFLPILTAIHAIFGGVLYYTYPYIILVSSILSTATVLAKNHITGFRQLFGSKRLIAIMVGHWLILGYGLLALTQVSKPAIHGPMFVLVITPAIFYLATSSLTDPAKFKR